MENLKQEIDEREQLFSQLIHNMKKSATYFYDDIKVKLISE